MYEHYSVQSGCTNVWHIYVCQCTELFSPFSPPNRCNYTEIELLFQLLRAFTGRFLCNMTFLKEYMEEEIPRKYSIAQKRALFFRFVEFNDPHFNDELKAKVRLQQVYQVKAEWTWQRWISCRSVEDLFTHPSYNSSIVVVYLAWYGYT